MVQQTEREYNPSRENARMFYRGLTLPDVFGKAKENPKSIPITWEQYKEWSENSTGAASYARAFGIEEIGALASNGRIHGIEGPCIMESVSTPKLSWWLPHVEERQLLLQVAQAVTGGKRPMMMEVGHGTGFVAKMLALEGNIDVIGVDNEKKPLEYKTGRVPQVPNVTLLTGDIWDVINTFGPNFNADERMQRQKFLAQVREAGQTIAFSDFLASHVGSATELNDEIAQLQEVSKDRLDDSSIDIVLCSFMELNSELTIPIRDGIFPKAIVYVKPDNSRSGGGDYYEALEDVGYEQGIIDPVKWNNHEGDDLFTSPNLNTHISFNPGVNYSTVAAWSTPWAQDYPHFGHSFAQKDIKKPTGKVVIQVRNDVILGHTAPVNVERYNVDDDMEALLGNNLQDFLGGIISAKSSLKL